MKNAPVTRRRYDAAGSKTICPHCESTNHREQHYSDEVEFKFLSLDVEGLVRQECLNCGQTWLTESQATHNGLSTKLAFETERNRIRERDGLLTGAQICELRKALDLNQRQAASIFGGGSNAFNKYESGEVLQSFAMDRLLRLTCHVGHPAVSFLSNVAGQISPTVMTLKVSSSALSEIEIDTFSEPLLSRNVRSAFVYEPETHYPFLQSNQPNTWLFGTQLATQNTINMENMQNENHAGD